MAKKLGLGCLGIVIFFAVIGAVASKGSSSNSKSTLNNTDTNTNVQTPTQEVKKPEVVITSELIAEFDKNKLAAEDKYKDKYIEFEGKVKNISEDIAGTPYLSIEPVTNQEYYFGTTLACYFNKNKQQGLEIVKGLENGEIYSLRGTISGMTLGIITVNNCEVTSK